MPSDIYTLTISDVGVSTPADGSVTTAKIVNLNVTNEKVADSAITSAKILNGAVTSEKILDGTIVAGDIADGTITSAKILDGTIGTAKITDLNITTGKLAANAVISSKILDGNVTTDKIAGDNVTFAKIEKTPANTILCNPTGGTANVTTRPCTALGLSLLSKTAALDVRELLELSTMATQASNAVAITGGTIDGVTISGVTANMSSVVGTLATGNGGTGRTSYVTGDILYASGPSSISTLAKPSNTAFVLHGAGSGAAPSWGQVDLATDVVGVLPTANGGTGGASIDTLAFLTTGVTTDALATGEMRWNNTDKTLDLKLAGDVTLQVGQESNIYVHNSESVQIPNGSVVYIYGSEGQNPAVKLASNNTDTAKKTLGIATQDISAGQNGYVTTQGIVRGLDTSAYTSGTALYLGIDGALTSIEPPYPDVSVRVAIVVSVDAVFGSIYVQPQLFSDGRVSGTFLWGAGGATGPSVSIANLTATSEVIIQQRGNTVIQSFYSVVCNTGSFTPYATAAGGSGGSLPASTTSFSYIAFI